MVEVEKHFTIQETTMIRIRPILTILFIVLFAGPLLAGDIIVHANLPVGLVPAECREMTAKQFEAWAKAQNEKALLAAKAKHDAYLEARGPITPVSVSEHSGGNFTQLGGLNGRSGVGSSGGIQSGYGLTGYSPATSRSGNVYTGSTIRSNFTDNYRTYQVTPRDWNDDGGGPVEIINPFCWDFWQKHIQD